MKFFIVLSLALFAITQAYPSNEVHDKIHIPEKCSDVLAVKVCDRLHRMATGLKLKSEEVKKAVVEAYKQGKTQTEEIYNKTREILVNKVMTKRCEDFLESESCKKLYQAAQDLKLQAMVARKYIMEQIAELKTKECEDFLDEKKCAKLKDVAGKLKMRAEKLREMMVESYLEYKTNATEMLKETYNKVRTYVMSTRCEDMFNPDLCVAFRKYAEKTKVALPRIMETAYNLVVKGVAVGKDLVKKVFDIVDYFYDCTDIFDESSCKRLESFASKLVDGAEKVTLAFKKYMRIAIEKGTGIYTTIKEFLKNKIYCRFSSSCSDSDDVAEMEDELAYGLFDKLDMLKEKVKKFLDERYPDLEDKVRERVMDIVNKAKTKFQLMSGLVKAYLESAKKVFNEIMAELV